MDTTAVLEALGPQLRAKPVMVTHDRRTKFRATDTGFDLKVAEKVFPLEDKLVYDLASFSGLGQDAAKKLSPATLERAMNELLAKKERYALMREGEEVRAVLPALKSQAVDIERAVRDMGKVIGDGVDFRRALVLPDQSVQLQAIGVEVRPVRVPGGHTRIDDLISAGVMVTISGIGSVDPQVQSFTERQVCTNGLVIPIVGRTFSGRGGPGEGDDVWQWYRQSVRDAYRSIDPAIARLQEMVEEGIDPADRAGVIEALLKEAGISGADANTVRARAIAEPPRNMFDAFNHLTWATTHLLTDPRRVVRAQRAHGAMADRENRHRLACPSCGRGAAHAPVVVEGAAREVVS